MKKVLITILVIMLLLGVAGVGAGYYFVYRPAKAYLASLTQLREIPKLEAQVRNRSAFRAPANDELTAERVARFVRTQASVRQQLGVRVEELGRKYETLSRATSDQYRPSVKEALGALRDLAGLVLEAKRIQVDALNQQAFSVEEYEWTRARVYEASGIPMDFTLQYAIRDAAAGRVPNFEPGAAGATRPVPEKNRTLVSGHLPQLTDAAPLAFFGL